MKNAMKVSKMKSVTIRMGHWHLVMPLLLTLMFGLGQPASVKAENLDAIFANSGDTNRVCLGDGSGGFTCSDVSANTNASQSVAVGFVDGDSFLDAVFANGSGGAGELNRVCLGDGLGGFDCSDVSTDVRLSWGVALGLVNNDSFLDAVFANRLPGQANQVCFGDGTGGFTSPCTDITALESVAVALGFMNADSNLDAVFGNFDGTISVCLGDGLGGFTSPCTDHSGWVAVHSVKDVALGFFNGDSFLDVAVAMETSCLNTPGCANGICFGDGAGGFSSCGNRDGTSTNKPNNDTYSYGVAMGFVDGDSFLDAVFAKVGQTNTICDINDPGGFILPCSRVVSADENSSYSVALGLVNGDSFLDAVFANRSQPNRVCLGDGTGGFDCDNVSINTLDMRNNYDVALGDFDTKQIFGGCCFDDATCMEVTETECTDSGGSYQDDDTLCSDTDCPLLICPGEGDCCEDSGSPGCEDCNCQETVCDIDSTCCDNTWDSECAAIAEENCLACNPQLTSDTDPLQLYSFFDLRDRESFVQVTNVVNSPATVHVQVFNVNDDCNENNFFDVYTGNDTHVYNLSDITTNNGNPSGVVLPPNAYGFVVVTVVESIGGPTSNDSVLIGNFRIIDNKGYEYRTNSSGVRELNPIEIDEFTFNYNTKGDITLSDVVGININQETSAGEVDVSPLNSYAIFDVDIYNDDEVPFSCRDIVFACIDEDNPLLEQLLEDLGVNVARFEYGINEAIPHSRDGELLCPGNNIVDGVVKLNPESSNSDVFTGYIGLNSGNGRGSMDSFWRKNFFISIETQPEG